VSDVPNDLLENVPQLARGCRVQSRSEDEAVLLVPEGLLRLKGSAVEILGLVDGVRKVSEITATLQLQYPPEAHEQIAAEVNSFLRSLHGRSVLLFKEV
jgi:pyrroloquinoline quinone biosynthesis protein D